MLCRYLLHLSLLSLMRPRSLIFLALGLQLAHAEFVLGFTLLLL